MSLIRRTIQVAWPLLVFFTENVFVPDNSTLRDALADVASRKVFVVLEDSLSQARPELEHQIEKYFATHAQLLPLVRPPLFVSGGEPAKNSITLVTNLLEQFHRHHLDRHSYLIAIGGGAGADETIAEMKKLIGPSKIKTIVLKGYTGEGDDVKTKPELIKQAKEMGQQIADILTAKKK